MTKRKVFCLALEVTVVAGVALFVLWWPLVGWLRHEKSYQEKPTSYWHRELEAWQPSLMYGTSHRGGKPSGPNPWRRESSTWDGVWLWPRSKSTVTATAIDLPPIPLLNGDPEAERVLTELMSSSNPSVQLLAKLGLEAIRQKAER